jgi:hypothetical protein
MENFKQIILEAKIISIIGKANIRNIEQLG